MNRSAPWGALALLVLSSACARGDAARERVAVRDSAGVQIVESMAPAWEDGGGWRLSAEPLLQIGQLEGAPEYQLDRVRDARRLSTGEVAVANGGSSEVRIYSPDGRFLRALGREGGGPGEFRMLSWLQVLPGDSLLAFDARERRLSVFAPDGSLAGASTLERNEGGLARPLARLADGSLLAQTTVFSGGPPADGLAREPVSLSRLSPAGEPLGVVAELLGDERVVSIQSNDGGMTAIMLTVLPFHRRTVVAPAPEGIWAADTDRYELRLLSPDGRLTRLVRRPGDPVPVTEADREQYREQRLADAEDAAQRQRVEALRFPEAMPAFSAIRTDAGGHLWVQDFVWPGDSNTAWSVFDPQGRLLGAVELPERFRPTEIGEDYVLGTWRDDLDVEYVRMYALVKP